MQKAIDKGRQYLQDALDEWKPNAVFAGFSGGGDSLMVTHLLHELRDDVGVLHVNTGIGMKRTRQYVRDTCQEMDWDLDEYKATDYGYDYDEMVRGNVTGVPGGFPGPPMHYIYYGKLKEVPIQGAHRDFKGKRGGKIALVTGIRKDESQVRTGYDATVVDELNGVVWINLIYYVTASQKQKYISTHGLKTNPVSDVYGMSGECLCLEGGTLVSTPNGWQRIKDLGEGDEVHNYESGRLQSRRVYVVHQSGGNPTYRLKPYYLPSMKVTGNHPIWVRPYTFEHHNRTSRKSVGPSQYLNADAIYEAYEEGKGASPFKRTRYYIGRPFITETNDLGLSGEQLRLLGYFAAEGAYNWRKDEYRDNPGGIVFTVSAKHSLGMANQIQHSIEEGLGLPTHWRRWVDDRTGREYITVRNLSEESSRFIEEHFRGRYSHQKRFAPKVLRAAPDQQSVILDAMWSGDGSQYTIKRVSRSNEEANLYGTTSRKLALQVQTILLRQEVVSGIRRANRSDLKSGEAFHVAISQGKSPKYGFIENGVLWASIYQVQEAGQAETFNLTVEGEPNFLTEAGLVHNCGAFDTGGSRLCELKHACEHFNEPETYERIISLQDEVRHRFPWRYDEGRPAWYSRAKNGQLAFEGMPGAEEANRVARMCVGCGKSQPDP